MSRAFHPPETLSKEDVRTIAEVRRDVWTNGFKGLFYGSASGYTFHTASRIIYERLDDTTRTKINQSKIGQTITGGSVSSNTPIKFTRNTAFLSFMLGGALGSFIMATTAGKNKVHNLHDIYKIGERDTSTPYQQAVTKAKEEAAEKDRALARTRRLSRRRTMEKRIEEGTHGLSDSHGGRWVDEDSEVASHQEAVVARRTTVKERLEKGRGLSDSHGGKWQ